MLFIEWVFPPNVLQGRDFVFLCTALGTVGDFIIYDGYFN